MREANKTFSVIFIIVIVGIVLAALFAPDLIKGFIQNSELDFEKDIMPIFAIIIGFIIVGTLVFLFIGPMLKRKKIFPFAQKYNFQVIKKPDKESIQFPDFFYNEFGGRVPLEKARNYIKTPDGIEIFTLSYTRISKFAKIRRNDYDNIYENQFGFLVTINPLKGYHKFLLKNNALSGFLSLKKLINNSGVKDSAVNDPELQKIFKIKSNNKAELDIFITKLKPLLLNLAEILNKQPYYSIDGMSTNLSIHLVQDKMFLRAPIQYIDHLEHLYLTLREIVK